MIILMDQKQTRLWGLCQECEIQQLTSGKHKFDCVPAPFESFSDPPLSHYQPKSNLLLFNSCSNQNWILTLTEQTFWFMSFSFRHFYSQLTYCDYKSKSH